MRVENDTGEEGTGGKGRGGNGKKEGGATWSAGGGRVGKRMEWRRKNLRKGQNTAGLCETMPRTLVEVLTSERRHAVGTGLASAGGAPGAPGKGSLNCETRIGTGGCQRGFDDSCPICTVRVSEMTCRLRTRKGIQSSPRPS